MNNNTCQVSTLLALKYGQPTSHNDISDVIEWISKLPAEVVHHAAERYAGSGTCKIYRDNPEAIVSMLAVFYTTGAGAVAKIINQELISWTKSTH